MVPLEDIVRMACQPFPVTFTVTRKGGVDLIEVVGTQGQRADIQPIAGASAQLIAKAVKVACEQVTKPKKV